jgi:methionyl aminopeptidase
MKKKRSKKAGKRRSSGPSLQGPEGVEGMRAAGRLASEILDQVAELIRPGVSTAEIDRLVDELTSQRGAKSAPYGYQGNGTTPFPGHCCTSINDVVCHGIPDPGRLLADGDIINVDVTPILDGYHGDTSRTFLVGEVSPIARRLVADTHKAMWLGIEAVRPGGRVGDIGHAIQSFAEAQGYSVVREFTGHGIGTEFHTPPAVLHYGTPNSGERLLPGMTFTIEPMINLGHWKTEILDDGWTAVTVDGTLSAQFEHTILLTEDGPEVLTLSKEEGEENPERKGTPNR